MISRVNAERVLTVLEELESLLESNVVSEERAERLIEKYKAEREDTFQCFEERLKNLEKTAEMQETMIKVLVEYIQFKGL